MKWRTARELQPDSAKRAEGLSGRVSSLNFGLTIPAFLTIINPICKDDDVQRAEANHAESEPGRVQARCAGGSAALQRVPGEEPGV